MPAICVFCGSSPGRAPAYQQAAERLGRLIAQRGCTLVYGGATSGLMGTVADAALSAGGEVIGVVPTVINDMELAHHRLTRLHQVETMHERKALMADLADAFIALPGGMGTLDELCEILTWAQLDLHRKPVGLLNVEGYWHHFMRFLDHTVAEGFLRPAHHALMASDDQPERLLARLLDAAGRSQRPASA
jgi:uncharacterized protein (TIGR00730 family)